MSRPLVFIVYKYFPFGGLQRDFLRIAQACEARGPYPIRVFTMSWEGERPPGWRIKVMPANRQRSLTQIGKYRKFTQWVWEMLEKECDIAGSNPLSIGFNKMPGLAFYYAADPCFAEKASTMRGRYYKLTPRYRHFMDYERAVFAPESQTQILMISETQLPFFQRHYDTPKHRFHMLPPTISRDRRAPENAMNIREAVRVQLGLAQDQCVVVMVATDFKNKGLDRTLTAVGSLPQDLRDRTTLLVIGQDNAAPYAASVSELRISNNVRFLGARSDVGRLLLAADVLLHPARHENTGTVILEALVAGTPAITTANCGYAHYVTQANAGIVLPMPFDQSQLDQALTSVVRACAHKETTEIGSASSSFRDGLPVDINTWRTNALNFGKSADIYSMPERAADLIIAAAH